MNSISGEIGNDTVLSRFLIAFAFVLGAAALVYGHVWPQAPIIGGDSPDYMKVAQDLQDFRLDYLADRTPGYPLLLLLTGSAVQPTRVLFYIQMAFAFGSIFLLAKMMLTLRISKILVGLFILLALLPPNMEKIAYVLTEPLTEFLLVTSTAALLFFVVKQNWVALVLSALTIGFSAITRPTYQLLFLALMILLLSLAYLLRGQRKKLIIASVTVAIVSVACIGGLMAYNYHQFQYLGLTPLLGFNLSTRTVNVVERLPDEYSDVRSILIEQRDQQLTKPHSSHSGLMYIWSARGHLHEVTGLNGPELSNYMMRLNLFLIRTAPLEYLRLVFQAASSYWFPVTDLSNFNSRGLQLTWSAGHFFISGLFFLQNAFLLGIGFVVIRSPKSIRNNVFLPFLAKNTYLILAILFSLLIVYYTMIVSIMVEVGNPRYRTPTDLLILFSMVCIYDLGSRLRRALNFLEPQRNYGY